MSAQVVGPVAPLAGMRVVELSSYVAAPLAGMTLAQLGAEVIRVDPPGGAADRRRWPVTADGESLYWAGLNRGKRSVEIDLDDPEGREFVTRMVTAGGAGGGILLTNNSSPKVPQFADLVTRRPDVIRIQLHGRPDGGSAVDYTVNAASGFAVVTGPPEHGEPVNHVLPAWDIACGLYVAVGLLAAERDRRATGRPHELSISLADVALATASNLGFLAEAEVNQALRPKIGNAVYGTYVHWFTTADDERVIVVALTPRHWRDLIAVTGTGAAMSSIESGLGCDFTEETDRYTRRHLLDAVLAPWFAQHAAAAVVARLGRTSVPCSRFATFAELVDPSAETAADSPILGQLDQPGIGRHLAAGSPLLFDGHRAAPQPAPALGEHTTSVLRDLLELDSGNAARGCASRPVPSRSGDVPPTEIRRTSVARERRHDILFEEIQLGPKRMRNRFYQSPHCTSFGTDLPGAQAHHRAVKAEGGWGAVNTEFCSVHPSSDSRPYVSATLWDQQDMKLLAGMAEMAHEHGALAGVELWHGGAGVGNLVSRLPAGGVSAGTDENYYATNAYELDRRAIQQVQQYYVDAAVRARDAGFDIVNVHGAEAGGIPGQFLMRKFNRRTDEYGGSLENRARFWIETLEQVRAAVGDSCAVTARLCIDTLNDSELGMRAGEEAYGFIQLADHLVDFWDLQAGGWTAAEWHGDDAIASRFGPEFAHREYYAAVRGATSKPIAAVGRFTNPDTMAEAIRSGVIDIIAAARPSIADPFLPSKIEQGRYDEVRECIGCNICASRFVQGTPIICTQNPTVGEEYRRGWHPERFSRAANADRSVLVVGAGPAGMECAVVLGKRGIAAVHLIDENPKLGGSARRAASYPNLGEWSRLVDWREIQLARLPNVEVILGRRSATEDVLTYGAEIVVVATGSRWRADGMNGPTQAPIAGADLPHVHTPEQVAAVGGAIYGEQVLVYDTDGYFTAVGMIELLLAQGKRVRVVTPFPNLSPYLLLTGEGFRVNRELRRRGVQVVTGHTAVEITDAGLRAVDGWGGVEQSWAAEAVVLVTQREPCDELFHDLNRDPDRLRREGIQAVYRVGDCVTPGIMADAIFAGHRLGREIDTADPATPLPARRELPLLPARVTYPDPAAVPD